MEEDDLFDDSLLSRRTIPQSLNMSSMSYSSRQGGKLSLAGSKFSSRTKASIPKPNVGMAFATARKEECERCGLPASLILGSLESHSLSCAGVGFKKPRLDSTCHVKDLNQNVARVRPLKHTEESHQAATGSQDNRKEAEMPNSQQIKPSGQSNVRLSQQSAFTSCKTSQKPSDILKKARVKAHNIKTIRPSNHPTVAIQPFNIDSLNLQSRVGLPWSIGAMKIRGDLETANSHTEFQVDNLIPNKKPKKRRRKTREQTCDWSYVQGQTTSEEDSDEDVLKACPVFKRIPGTSFAVDALCHGKDSRVEAHFLTRFREENCRQRSSVPIYCTPITAALMRGRCGFEDSVLRPLEYDEPRMIAGVKVTAIDAHNEPGSALLLFQLPGNVNILYVGDLRPDLTLESHPAFWSPGFVTDYLMVDTERCKSGTFRLLREDLEHRLKTLVKDCLKRHPKSLVAFVLDGLTEMYLLTALALRLDLKVFAHADCAATLAAVDVSELNELLTASRTDATLHVIPQTCCKYNDLTARLKMDFSHVIAVNPRKDLELASPRDLKPVTDWSVTVIDVPIVDGTSFSDLERLVRFLRPKRLVSPLPPCRDPIQSEFFRQWLDRKDPVVLCVPYERK